MPGIQEALAKQQAIEDFVDRAEAARQAAFEQGVGPHTYWVFDEDRGVEVRHECPGGPFASLDQLDITYHKTWPDRVPKVFLIRATCPGPCRRPVFTRSDGLWQQDKGL